MNRIENDNPKLKTDIEWLDAKDPEFPYKATIGMATWKLGLNDFPDEPLYTLYVDGEAQFSFDDWPQHWDR